MTDQERFMAKVAPQDDGCWHWTAAIQAATGYGRFGFNGAVTYAHRVAWQLFCGSIPAGMHVCHKCDVRHCVNPAHLFIGSRSDNMRDASAKGRVRVPAASFASDETHQPAKLTNDQVRTIRSSMRRDTGRLAAEFGVCASTIWAARTGRTFKDVLCD